MRITDVKVYTPAVGERNQCLVKVETDTGLYGWGESGLSYREDAVAGAIGHFRDLLIGQDPMRPRESLKFLSFQPARRGPHNCPI